MTFLSQFLHLLRHTEQRGPFHSKWLRGGKEAKTQIYCPAGNVSERADFVEGEGVIFFRDLQMDMLCLCDFYVMTATSEAGRLGDLFVIALLWNLHADAVK